MFFFLVSPIAVIVAEYSSESMAVSECAITGGSSEGKLSER